MKNSLAIEMGDPFVALKEINLSAISRLREEKEQSEEWDFNTGAVEGYGQAQDLSYEDLRRGAEYAKAMDETKEIPADAYALLEERIADYSNPLKVIEWYGVTNVHVFYEGFLQGVLLLWHEIEEEL